MAAENEAYGEGGRVLRHLRRLRADVELLDASDTQCKERVLQSLQQAEQQLERALRELAGLV
ncbi:MAG: hypothetical protein FJX77_14105 [Armatimonadetes bacterium]|nr:hypothetical protein [Armatimonadota bacterium]